MNNILICSSSPENIYFIIKAIHGKYPNTNIANSEIEAINLSKIFLPQVIIIDASSKEINIYKVCFEIKNYKKTKKTSVILVDNNFSTDLLTKALFFNVDDFIELKYINIFLAKKISILIGMFELKSKLKSNNNILKKQLAMAKELQNSIIPEINLNLLGIEISSCYVPSIEISGDFYDVYKLDDERIYVMIGDISGHGISSALMTPMIKMMFLNLCDKKFLPDSILNEINKKFFNLFKNNSTNVYICMFCAIINTKEKSIIYSNAGNVPPTILNTSSKNIIDLSSTNKPIGINVNSIYNLNNISYNVNEILFMYTDGLINRFSKNHITDVSEELKKVLLNIDEKETPKNMIDKIIQKNNISKENNMHNDDISILILKLK